MTTQLKEEQTIITPTFNLKKKSNDKLMNKKENNNVAKKTIKKKKPRCSFCNIRIKTFANIKCRCGLSFCPSHLLPEYHKCTYDYKKDKLKLEKVVADKVIKI